MAKKSGRERKAKRRAKKLETQQLPSHWDATSDREERQNLALLNLARRWNTEATQLSFANAPPNGHTTKALAELVTRRALLSANPKVANEAVRHVLQMEAQNQRDEIEQNKLNKEQAPTEQHNHLHLAVTNEQMALLSRESLLEFKRVLESEEEKPDPTK